MRAWSITDVRFFGYDDAALTLGEELILQMAALIREVRPDVSRPIIRTSSVSTGTITR